MVIENGEESGNGASGKAGETLYCASCGIAEVDDIKLTTCDADCKLVRYCSDACQRDHRSQHKEECKKRVAELRDELLFVQPESSHYGDCPICFLPLSLDGSKIMMTCCSKLICNGCSYANKERELNASLKRTCPFCRHPVPTTNAESDANIMKRVEVNDPVALRKVGIQCSKKKDFTRAFEYLTKAAGAGDVAAHNYLSLMYKKGEGVEKDEKMAVYHAEEAAIGGDPIARYILGVYEWYYGSKERAVKHFIIAANLRDVKSVETLKKGYYLRGVVSKEDFAAALRAHQAAVDAMKSPERDAASAEKARRRNIK
eukprot:scaffold3120_cov219-Skeletonema_marinoi.AAC.12